MVPDLDSLTGKTDVHIDRDRLPVPLHRDVVAPFRALQRDARAAGFDLQPVSGFRDFARQLRIWNAKAGGERPVLDATGVPLALQSLSPPERVFAILRWSALPGASRHHWGTDIDIYDAAAVPAGYRVQLTPVEVADDGVFGPLHRWLDSAIASGHSHGFVRPYGVDRGGVAPERWHLSYAPIAMACQAQLSEQVLAAAVLDTPDLSLRDTIAEQWTTIFRRFIDVDRACYAPAGALKSPPGHREIP